MMKDKLYKYHHTTAYYVARKTVFGIALFLSFSVAVAVPTTINLLTTKPSVGLAEEAPSENTSEGDDKENQQSESELVYTSIQQQ